MASLLRQSLRLLTACILVTIFAIPQSLLAQAHLVGPEQLHQQLLSASQARKNNLESLQSFFSSAMAGKALRSLHADRRQVTTAISSLSDQELARLAARAHRADADFAAGNINDHDLLIILVAILVLILIIVAVRH